MPTMKKSLAECGALAFLPLAAVALPGCGPNRDEFLWMLGSSLFLVYAVVIAVVLTLPAIHRIPWFIRLAAKLRTPTAILGKGVTLAGAAIMAIGLPRLFSDDFGPRKLLAILGCMVFAAGRNLSMWAKAQEPERKTEYAKVVILSISFGVGLLFVILGASEQVG